MRIVVDTNILVSALLAPASLPAQLLVLWRQDRFILLTATEQFDELRRVTRYPKIRERLPPALAGRLINDLRGLAVVLDRLPSISVSPDPNDDYLLAIAEAGGADVLLTGDKRDLLSLQRHGSTRILTVRAFLDGQGRAP
ncbi:MAG: putative toxin-antitoxin system toxin component, PIN family [Gluconacetobacter diazotrophicus]|nr:putative toxin-antitoxin system toxin component, PIN family [Gluconacetobacter diazotrophicus]